jgi:ElaB/YqjD/DUF883 family membrane-anchored ribosome-binding protein
MIASDPRTRPPLFPDAESSPMAAVTEQCSKFEEKSVDWIRQYPAYAVGIAAAIGVTLGWLLKRR